MELLSYTSFWLKRFVNDRAPLPEKLSEIGQFFFFFFPVILVCSPRPWDFSSGIIAVLIFSKPGFGRKSVLSSQIEERRKINK